MTIEDRAQEILKDFPIVEHMPASISGKHHIGETHREHLEFCANIERHLCDEFNISPEDRDMLLGATYLHDVGLYIITQKGKIEAPNWEYFEKTGYSRLSYTMKIHPIISASIINEYKIDRKEELKKLVSSHMSHWYKDCPQPNSLLEYLLCTTDYVASRGKGIFEYKGFNK